MSRKIVSVTHLGCPGHLIFASMCRWHRHTQVGDYRISTIGDYYPGFKKGRDTIGSGANEFFETMVFKTTCRSNGMNEGCGCKEVISWEDIDGDRYATAGEAQDGHERFIQKYLDIETDRQQSDNS